MENMDSTLNLVEAEVDYGECPSELAPSVWEQWKAWKMRPANDFIFQVEQGAAGKNVGLSNGLKYINRYLYGTHRARYYLIGADSNCGKTTIGDFMFVIQAWYSARKQGRKIKVFYCSFEIGRLDKIARWVSYFVFLKFGVRIPSDYTLGRIAGIPLSAEHKRMVQVAYGLLEEMMKDINFIDTVLHPTKIFEDMIEGFFEKNGKVEREEVREQDPKKPKKRGYIKGYQPNDPDLVVILFIDTLNLIGHEMSLSTKDLMDKMSRYIIILRNMFHVTAVVIQQFNPDMMTYYRVTSKVKSESIIAPQRLDFGDSKAPFRDACVVIGLVKPALFDLKKFSGYDITRQGLFHCFIAAYVMKNRYGPSGRCVPLFLDGISGHVYDLPLEAKDAGEFYKQAQEIEALCQVFSPKE